jgi:hypothetical protein
MFFDPCAISNAVLRALKPASASPTIAFPILQKSLISGRRLALLVVLKFRGIVTDPRRRFSSRHQRVILSAWVVSNMTTVTIRENLP